MSENFQFLEVKFSICLNRRVFLMSVKRNSQKTLVVHKNIHVCCGYPLDSNIYPQHNYVDKRE